MGDFIFKVVCLEFGHLKSITNCHTHTHTHICVCVLYKTHIHGYVCVCMCGIMYICMYLI